MLPEGPPGPFSFRSPILEEPGDAAWPFSVSSSIGELSPSGFTPSPTAGLGSSVSPSEGGGSRDPRPGSAALPPPSEHPPKGLSSLQASQDPWEMSASPRWAAEVLLPALKADRSSFLPSSLVFENPQLQAGGLHFLLSSAQLGPRTSGPRPGQPFPGQHLEPYRGWATSSPPSALGCSLSSVT